MPAQNATAGPSTTKEPVWALTQHYAVMYSNDIHKNKSNRQWHDGFLAYHLFNRRMILRDIEQQELGDLFYKPALPLQSRPSNTESPHSNAPGSLSRAANPPLLEEGLEIEMDNHVVEVGEFMSVSKSNIAPVLEARTPKRKASEIDSAQDSPRSATGSSRRRNQAGCFSNEQGTAGATRSGAATNGSPQKRLGESDVDAATRTPVRANNNAAALRPAPRPFVIPFKTPGRVSEQGQRSPSVSTTTTGKKRLGARRTAEEARTMTAED